MNKEIVEKIEESISLLNERKNKLYFLVQDTKGNANASLRHIYQIAYALKDFGFNVIMIHEKEDYVGVGSWLDKKYETIPHKAIDGQDLEVKPEDYVIIPELYSHVMEQIQEVTCGKIVMLQAHDYCLETLNPGTNWAMYGFLKVLSTSETLSNEVKTYMKYAAYNVLSPLIPKEYFYESTLPKKPIITILSREQRTTMKIIKKFYLKYPQFKWVGFREMRNLSQEEFGNNLRDSMLSVWVDDISSFGTFPIESMACKTPVVGKVPTLIPEWMNEENGIWVMDETKIVDYIADFVQAFIEDTIPEKMFEAMNKTVNEYTDESKFINQTVELFEKLRLQRLDLFNKELIKING